MTKEEALKKIEELKAFIKEEEKPQFKKGQLVWAWDDDVDEKQLFEYCHQYEKEHFVFEYKNREKPEYYQNIEPYEKPSDWIEWNGGKFPVDEDTLVVVDVGNSYNSGKAKAFDWGISVDFPIKRYRVIEV